MEECKKKDGDIDVIKEKINEMKKTTEKALKEQEKELDKKNIENLFKAFNKDPSLTDKDREDAINAFAKSATKRDEPKKDSSQSQQNNNEKINIEDLFNKTPPQKAGNSGIPNTNPNTKGGRNH